MKYIVILLLGSLLFSFVTPITFADCEFVYGGGQIICNSVTPVPTQETQPFPTAAGEASPTSTPSPTSVPSVTPTLSAASPTQSQSPTATPTPTKPTPSAGPTPTPASVVPKTKNTPSTGTEDLPLLVVLAGAGVGIFLRKLSAKNS